MKVNSSKRPRVPVAAHWQQSGRGAKKVPDDSLPTPQVHNSTSPASRRTTPTEEAVKKTSRTNSSSLSPQNCKRKTPARKIDMDRTKNVSRTEMTNSQQKTFHQPETKKEKPNPHTGLNIGTWNVRVLILLIAIYGAESWTLRQADKRQLDTFEMRCLRVILGVSLMDKIRNEEIRQRLHLPTTICDEVSKRRLKLFGHVVRMPPHRLPFQAYTNDFLKRRPPARWREQIERDMGVPLKEAEHQAQGRPEWRRITRRRAKGHTILCS